MNEMQLFSQPMQIIQTKMELTQCNRMTERYGLTLSDQQMEQIALRRIDALQATGRVEFGESVLRKLVYAFCDSPYIRQAEYANTLAELLDLFYYFKGECMEQLTDDELIEGMRLVFDEAASGSLSFLANLDREIMEEVAQTGSLKGTPLEDGEIDWGDIDG